MDAEKRDFPGQAGKKSTPLESAMTRLGGEADSLRKTLNLMRDRVNPCLRPVSEDESKKEEKEAFSESPLEQDLRCITDTILNSQEIVMDINNRLCL